MVKKQFTRLKKRKILMYVLEPFIVPIILVLSSYLFNMDKLIILNWLEFLGLLLITIGAIYAIRPLIRNLLNPKINSKQKRKRDENSGLVAFSAIMVGFSMAIIRSLFILFGLERKILLIFLIISVDIIAFFLLIKLFKDLEI